MDTTSQHAGMNKLRHDLWLGRMSLGDKAEQTLWDPQRCLPFGLPGLRSLLDPSEIEPEKRRRPKDGPCFVPGVLALPP